MKNVQIIASVVLRPYPIAPLVKNPSICCLEMSACGLVQPAITIISTLPVNHANPPAKHAHQPSYAIAVSILIFCMMETLALKNALLELSLSLISAKCVQKTVQPVRELFLIAQLVLHPCSCMRMIAWSNVLLSLTPTIRPAHHAYLLVSPAQIPLNSASPALMECSFREQPALMLVLPVAIMKKGLNACLAQIIACIVQLWQAVILVS